MPVSIDPSAAAPIHATSPQAMEPDAPSSTASAVWRHSFQALACGTAFAFGRLEHQILPVILKQRGSTMTTPRSAHAIRHYEASISALHLRTKLFAVCALMLPMVGCDDHDAADPQVDATAADPQVDAAAADPQVDAGPDPIEEPPQGVATEQDRANANEKTISCYATMASKAYDATPTSACSTTISQDTRNGMSTWQVQANQSPTNGDIIKFWERTAGNRRELGIGMRGSVTLGDWLRDAQAQFWRSKAPVDNPISRLGTAPNVELLGNAPKFDAGFQDRVANLAPEVAAKLAALETWRSQGTGREIGVKIAGHSLGAATATILGLYVADRYKNDNNADVEVFAFNSPKPVNKDMADTYRKAVTDCDFNLHVFNNSQDVVSAVPVGAHHVMGESDFGGLNFGRSACAYQGHYRPTQRAPGMHLPSPLNPLAVALQAAGTFVLSRHDRNQWILSEPVCRLQDAPPQVAASWFPVDPMGGLTTNITFPVGRVPIYGSFDANLYNATHRMYMRAVNGGGGDVRFDAAVPSSHELFRITPGDHDCVRGGATITLRPVSKPQYYVRALFGDLTTANWLRPVPENLFLVINHTEPLGCIAAGDVISLQAEDGKFVAAEDDGDANADRDVMSLYEKFSVRNVQNVTPLPAPGTEGWQQMAGHLKQVSVGWGGAVWGVHDLAVYSYEGPNGWANRSNSRTFSYISVGNAGVVWAIGTDSNLYRRDAYTNWIRDSARTNMKQVSVGNQELWAVDHDDVIHRRRGVGLLGVWEVIPGRLKHVSVGVDGDVWGVSASNRIYRYAAPDWVEIAGPVGGLTKITVGMEAEILGIGINNEIYRYNDPGWQLVPGTLKDVSAGFNEEIWGVNAANQVYRLKNF